MQVCKPMVCIQTLATVKVSLLCNHDDVHTDLKNEFFLLCKKCT